MNTQQEWKTVATVHNPARKAFWASIFDGDQVPIVSFIPQTASLPGLDGDWLVYMLDLKAISDQQRERLIHAIAQKFHLSVDFVAENLDDHGVPILAEDVSVCSTDRALVMGAIL